METLPRVWSKFYGLYIDGKLEGVKIGTNEKPSIGGFSVSIEKIHIAKVIEVVEVTVERAL